MYIFLTIITCSFHKFFVLFSDIHPHKTNTFHIPCTSIMQPTLFPKYFPTSKNSSHPIIGQLKSKVPLTPRRVDLTRPTTSLSIIFFLMLWATSLTNNETWVGEPSFTEKVEIKHVLLNLIWFPLKVT